MNKPLSLILALMACVMLVSCDNQQPGPRVDPWGHSASDQRSAGKVYVPFTRNESNLIEIEVSINGVPMKMLLDTGASVTSLSRLEFFQLLKAGKISDADYIKEIKVQIGNGKAVTESLYYIRGLEIKGKDNQSFIVRDFPATVSDNLSAPLLLGQDVIMKLPRYFVDDEKGMLVFDKN